MVAKDGCIRDLALGERLDNLEQGLSIVSANRKGTCKSVTYTLNVWRSITVDLVTRKNYHIRLLFIKNTFNKV